MTVAAYVEGHAEASGESAPRRTQGTILLVEDEDFVRNVTCEVLESAGYRVLVARNALEAAGIFERYSKLIELLITDCVMPGQDGRTLAKNLLSRHPGMKVIVSSGYPEPAAAAGSPDNHTFFLPKPFSVPSLMATVARVLGQGKPDQATGAACGR